MKYQIFIFAIIILFSIYTISASAQQYPELGIEIQTVAENLKVPWGIAFAPNGTIYFTERSGDLRVIQNGQLNPNPIASFQVGKGEGGLLGITLDPNFENNSYLYLYYTYNDSPIYNKVVRYTITDNQLSNETILIDEIPGASYHDGGRIRFAPDDTLYITTGDAGNAESAQDVTSLSGKILRINSDGTIPDDNPFENSPVYSYGHRNPQGLDWHPDLKILVISEHGPSGERGFAHDEVNVISAGNNYGWPDVIGDETGENFINPIIHTGFDTWAPSGASFYNSHNIEDWYGKYLIATLRGNHLRILDLDLENNKVISSKSILNDFGRLRDASMGPDGNLYLLTSNQDGRGIPASNDDRILRVVPLSGDSLEGDVIITPQQDWQQYLVIVLIISAVAIFVGSRLILLRK